MIFEIWHRKLTGIKLSSITDSWADKKWAIGQTRTPPNLNNLPVPEFQREKGVKVVGKSQRQMVAAVHEIECQMQLQEEVAVVTRWID